MAGGINPFGFTAGIIPAPRAPRQPQDLPSAPFGFAPPKSKLQQTWKFLRDESSIGAPFRAVPRLMKTPLPVLLGMEGTEAQQEQAVADSFDAGGGFAMTGSLFRRPSNSIGTASAVGKPKEEPFGFTVFHGSPHDFPPVRLIEMPDGTRLYQNMNELADTPQGAKILKEYPLGRFDMSKIGTGEGAQAYGHGLYFAENEGVAKGYRDALAPAPSAAQEAAQRTLQQFDGDAEAAANHVAKFIEDNGSGMFPETVEHYRSIETMLREGSASPGSMYEVRINADPDTFLDWDKPLSEQPEAVQRAFFDTYKVKGWKGDTVPLREVMQQYEAGGLDPMKAVEPYLGGASGHQAYSALSDQMGAIDWPVDADAALRGQFRANASEKTAKALREAGIPGIKYLDAGSRGAGDGTRNFVVFDDKLIDIVRKYGIAGASAMLGYNILDGMDPAQADELKRIEGNQ